MIAPANNAAFLAPAFPDRKRRNGNSAGHLHGGEQRVESLERGALQRDTEHGQDGVGCGYPGEVGRAAGARNDRLDAALLRFANEGRQPLRGAMGRDDAHVGSDSESLESFFGGPHHAPVALATHDDRYFCVRHLLQPSSLPSLLAAPLPVLRSGGVRNSIASAPEDEISMTSRLVIGADTQRCGVAWSAHDPG